MSNVDKHNANVSTGVRLKLQPRPPGELRLDLESWADALTNWSDILIEQEKHNEPSQLDPW